ncbi:MAG: tyrosine-type recombinase/integrase [Burkholderiales bacterium]|nr:tyrosine-type recombinase/integrase [Burkholderiales bacterium]
MSDIAVVIPGRTSASVFDASTQVPSLYAPDAPAAKRTFEFFAVSIRNPNTRKAYARAATEFATWCEAYGITDVRQVQPVHVASYIEGLQISAPSVKQRLAALRMLFDWLVIGQVMPTNPASSVRGPRHSVKKGKTAVLSAEEARTLLDSIDTSTTIGLRDRALIGLMVYTFARVGAAIKMRVEDVYIQGRRTWVRLHEKGGKQHEMPCHHNLEAWLHAYIDGAQLGDTKGYLFRSAAGRTGRLSDKAMAQADVFRMVGRRAEASGIRTRIGCHSFRATGITEYLRNGGKLEIAQQMANHESARTTGLYDRRTDQVNLDEVERIMI